MYGLIISIDPGSNGSIVYVKMKDEQPVGQPVCVKMPKEFKEINAYLKQITNGIERTICFIEKVNFRPSDMVGGKAFGLQKLMRNFEFCKAALTENGVNFIEVAPRKWQSSLKLVLPKEKAKQETDTARKNRYKEFAQKLFKAIKVVLWNSDALLILYFGIVEIKNKTDWFMSKLPDDDLDLLF